MLLWIGLGVMSAAILAVVLRPLLRAAPAEAPPGPDASAVYRDQLAEIETERERGLIPVAEAEAARVEVSRRLLNSVDAAATAATSAKTAGGLSDRWVSWLAVGLAAGVPALTIALYLAVGAPQLPGQPLSARLEPPSDATRVDELIVAVETRLRQHPEDGQGWDVIAPVYLKQGRFRDAAAAFANATRLLGESTRRLAGFAESSVLANDGIVTESARVAYEKLTRLEPGRIEPRFWLALAKEQDGQLAAAVAEYQAFLSEGPPDASWRPLVVERLETAQRRLGVATSSPLPPPQATAAPSTSIQRGPTSEDVAAAERLSTTDRQRMIEDMVQGLAERLKQDGSDLAGWQRLIRAYTVMGRKADAVAALGRARQKFTGEPQSLSVLSELARSLGLGT